MVFSRWDPENRVRGEILRILVVGELRGMVFNLLLGFLRKMMPPQKPQPPTIRTELIHVQILQKQRRCRARGLCF